MRPTELVPGNCYFQVSYCDPGMLFPIIQTLLYSRREDRADERLWIFQEPPSISSPDRVGDLKPGAECAFTDDQLYWILDFTGLARALGEVAHDHPIQGAPAPAGGHPDLSGLQFEVDCFLQNAELVSLTVTIQFTDDGVSVTRNEDGSLVVFLSLSTRLFPQHEPLVREVFADLGLRPREDYLANGGRVRILAYPVAGDSELLSKLFTRLLTGAFAMRPGDTLRYRFRSHWETPAVS